MSFRPIIAHGVQLFVLVRGRLAAGKLLGCGSAVEACRVAEEKVCFGRAVGAAALARTVVDPDYDDASEPVTLAIFGQVPVALADQLPF